MRKKKIGNALLAFTAVAMVLAVKAGSTDAYFTTYVEAQGSATVYLGGETHITENFDDTTWIKRLRIINEAGAEPVYVRARAFCGSQYKLTYEGDGWVEAGDGFWLYTGIVEGGQETSELKIRVDSNKKENSFDVTVIYESIPVQYDKEGNVLQPVVDGKVNTDIDWDKTLDVIESKPKGEIIDTSKPDGTQTPAPSAEPTPEPDQSSSESEEESSSEEGSSSESESSTGQDDTGSDNGGGN